MLSMKLLHGLNRCRWRCRDIISRPLHCCNFQNASYIFERDYELPDGRITKSRLEKKHYIYRIVGEKQSPSELEIVLTKDSLEHGVAGEVLSVETDVGRALIRNFEAVYASPENIEALASNFNKRSGQTISGRKMLLWLRTRDALELLMRKDVDWKLTPALVSRALLRCHRLVVPESALDLPKYAIKSTDPDSWGMHDFKISVNGADTVAMKMNIKPWNWKTTKR